MRFDEYAIDPADGSLTGLECPLRKSMRVEELPEPLRRHELASNDPQASYRLFRISRDHGGDRFHLDLRFEAERLVQLGIALSPREYRDLDDDAFYASIDARIRLHRQWMRRATGIDADPIAAAWGAMGVARDKSENVFVYLRWA